MANYYKESVVEAINARTTKKGYIALDEDLRICTDYSDKDFIGKVMVCHKEFNKYYWFEYIFHYDYCTRVRKDMRGGMTKIQEEILANWDAIIADTYISSVVLSKKKKMEAAKKREIAEEKKAIREAKRISDCKTFYADFFNPHEGNYLEAIDEIGRRLQDGEYSNLVLNDRIIIEFRTRNKRKDLPFTTNICGIRTFTDDSKYGDLWEDIDDHLEVYILNALVGATYNKKEYDFEQMCNNHKWLEMYANNKKEKFGDNEDVVKAADMLISSIQEYEEGEHWYETKLPWKDKEFIIRTLTSVWM